MSPGDGLTSLTQRPPGRPRAGPERYYPSNHRSFVRVGPTDLSEVERLVELLEEAGADRFAFVFDREIYGRELAAQLVERARRAGLTPVASEEYRGRAEDIPDIARSLAEKRPAAVVYLGVAGAATLPMINAIADQLPGVPLFAASGMLAVPGLALPPAPEMEAVGPELKPRRAGYEAMRLVLDAIAEGGRDRRRVVSAALRRGRDLPGRPGRRLPAGPGRPLRAGWPLNDGVSPVRGQTRSEIFSALSRNVTTPWRKAWLGCAPGWSHSHRRDILRVRWLAVLSCLLGAFALGLAACGDDDDDDGGERLAAAEFPATR